MSPISDLVETLPMRLAALQTETEGVLIRMKELGIDSVMSRIVYGWEDLEGMIVTNS
jgi:hypothetical protein